MRCMRGRTYFSSASQEMGALAPSAPASGFREGNWAGRSGRTPAFRSWNKSLRPSVGCKQLSLPAGCQPSRLLQPRERLGGAERARTEFVTGLAAKVPGVIGVAAAVEDPHPGRYPLQTYLCGARRLRCFPPEEVRLTALRSRLATSPPAGRAAAAPGAWLRRAAAWRRCACRC